MNRNPDQQTPTSGLPLDDLSAESAGHGSPGHGGAPGPAVKRAASGALPLGRRESRLSLSNWRVRWRLFAIIAIPTIAALVFGLSQVVNAGLNYQNFARVQSLASLNSLVVKGAGQLMDERDTIAGFVAQGKPSSEVAKVNAVQHSTDATLNQIQQQAGGIASDSSIRSRTRLDLKNGVLAGINDLTQLRNAALKTNYPPVSVIQVYDERVIVPFITFTNDIAAGTGNSTLQTDVTVLNSLLRQEDDASLQRAYLYQALLASPADLTPVALNALQQAAAQQRADASQFNAAASVEESQNFSNTVSGQLVDEAQSEEERAISSAGGGNGQHVQIGSQQTCTGALSSPAQCWFATQSRQIDDMRQVINGQTAEPSMVQEIQSETNSLVSGAYNSALLISALVMALIVIVIMITVIVARSMIRPLRKLRADALEIAGTKLPEMVRRLSESEGGDEGVEIEPIGVSSTDEIGEVARAFDQVHREAVRLAADEAMLRGNLNAMFVNLSRRSQSLIERQLSLIDDLEQSEQDPERLSSLFRLDHLATRMRRNSENLLVLAGHETARRWSQPVPLVDVLRAAVSEIEQFERVVLNIQPGIQVVGQAVNDVVHLVAEVVENATTFSPEDTQVYVTGQPLTSGGVLLDITDNGVGISEQEMAHANWRLDNPPVVDVAVSRRMGLFVVGRLAARHGVRVRLRHAQSGGLTALIWLPETVATPDGSQKGLGGIRQFGERDYGPPPSLSAPPLAGGPASFPGPGGPGGSGGPAAPGAPGAPGGPGGTGAAGAAGRMTRLAAGADAEDTGSFGGLGSLSGGSGPRESGPAGGDLPSRTADVPGRVEGRRLSADLPRAEDGDFGGDGTGDAKPLPVRQPRGPQPGGSPAPSQSSGPSTGSLFTRPGAEDGGYSPAAEVPARGTGDLPSRTGGLPSRNGNSRNGDTLAGGGNLPFRGTPGVQGSDGSAVTVPPSVSPVQEPRLPIFDSLETDWFRRSGTSEETGGSAAASAGSWNSAADDGWRAAQAVAVPSSEETTTAGLPKRVPRANLVPGSVGGEETPEEAPPTRSADAMRNRMSSFQRGVREARAAAPQSEEP